MSTKSTRRGFLAGTLAGAAAALPACGTPPAAAAPTTSVSSKYAKLDEILKQSVLKRQLFPSPVIIETLELLRLDDNFLCRVRSKDGAEGISAANNSQQRSLYPIQVNRLQPYFLGKDARDLETLLEEVYVYQSNYKMQSLALWVPLATIEFAILDMLGRIANKSFGQLVGDIHNPKVMVYRANGERDNSAEEVMENLKRQVVESQAKALKIKIGGRMSHVEVPAGRSEKLIPMVRKEFGDQMVCYADSNGSYDVAEGIRFGRLLEQYKFAFYEEPVPFDWYEETRTQTEKKQAYDYAATGMGGRVDHAVTQVWLDLEDRPAHTVNIRYEFRPKLVKLGILPRALPRDPLQRRERAQGFETEFCPEP